MGRNTNKSTNRANQRRQHPGVTDAETERVNALLAEWARQDARAQERLDSGTHSRHTLSIARKIGKVGVRLSRRHDSFTQKIGEILQHPYRVVGANALRLVMMTEEDIGYAAGHLKLPYEAAAKELLELPASATEPVLALVTDVVTRTRKVDPATGRTTEFRDLCLQVRDSTMGREMAVFSEATGGRMREMRLLIPIVEGEPGLHITPDQRKAAVSATQESFVREDLLFGPVTPLFQEL